ncbi:MAG: PH domain-containing protein, partial [Corynebacterium flavescens]|nr:PH domain-containing protein [Corynebacterium flavescens]
LELWTRAGHFKINIGPKIDIRALDQLISNCVFQ